MRRESVTIGQTRRHRPMYKIALFMGLLLLLGLVVMYALGPQRANTLNYALGTDYGEMFFFNKQLVSVVVSVVAFSIAAFVPYRLLTETLSRKLFIIGLVACVSLVFMGAVLHLSFAEPTNGAYRWFYIGGIGSFQPAELLKFGALLFVAGFLSLRASQGKLNDIGDTLLPLGIAMGVALFTVVVLQKDLGTGISLVAIALSIIVVSGIDGKIIRRIIGLLLVGALILTFSSPHRVERVMTYFQGDVNQSQDDNSYHIQQARIAIGSGGLFGLGIGKSVQASGYLPEAINDSIFAVMGETFGFVGLILILGLFTALLLSLLQVASRLEDMRLRLVAVGVFGWVASHVVMNIGSMTGVIPMTGISLPLLSYGGTSMLFIAAALGLVFQLSAYTSHKSLAEGGGNVKDFGSRRRFGRTRYTRGSGL